MAPKTKSRTAIWFYARDCLERGKIKPCSINEAIEIVYPIWKAMATHEKSLFEKMCEDWRREIKLEKGIFAEVPRHRALDSVYEEDNKDQEDLSKLLTTALLSNPSVNKLEKIKNQHWYFIKFQMFCKCEITPDSELINRRERYKPFYYVLAEVAILEYSLQNGIINEFHEFIKPNKVPLGYTGQCMDASKEEHQIPLHNFDRIQKTYEEIYSDIRSFLAPKQENNYCVPIFCMEKDLDSTRFGLNYLHNKSDAMSQFPFKNIYSLENFLVSLAKFGNTDFSLESAYDLLTSYAFDYAPNSRCDFHETLGISHCSLGLVKKASYLISDNICQFYDIGLTPKHIPIQKPVGTIIYTETSRQPSHKLSTTSLYSRASSKPSSDYQEPDMRNHRVTNLAPKEPLVNKNMPAMDIRRRPLVSDKLERIAQLTNDQNNSKINESTVCSNISTVNDKEVQNDSEEKLEDDDDDWISVKTKRKAENFSDRNSVMTGSNLSSVETRIMGRGRSLLSKKI